MKPKVLIAAAVCLACGLSPAYSETQGAQAPDITQLSLEQLMETEVTSPLKTPAPLARTPAAVFVLTQEDIRRSTAQTIPELLRMVPGLEVAQVTKNKWAISARGFNSPLANKLLVLLDGRTLYSPLYNQVYWDVQDVLLEDVERIEVIRGPGGTLWGSNAVNGVINIITKNAADTKGLLVQGGGGSERRDGAVRAGGGVGNDFSYRATGKYFHEDTSTAGDDAWHLGHGSARADWKVDNDDTLMASGDYYNGQEDIYSPRALAVPPYAANPFVDQNISGGHGLVRWNHVFSEASDGTLLTYFDHTNREETQFSEQRYTWDIEWDQRIKAGERHELVYGLGYQLQADDTDGSFAVALDPQNRANNLLQAFLQDTAALVPEKLWLTLGARMEHNDYSGWEFMPSARLLWNIVENHSVWAAFSRAVRIPSRLEHDLRQATSAWSIPGALRGTLVGDTTKSSEVVLAYEAGYRAELHRRLSVDTTVFYNDYSNLTTARVGTPYVENGSIVIPVPLDDQAKGETYGAELAMNAELAEWWQLRPAYSFLQMQIHQDAGDLSNSRFAEGQSPEHQLDLRSLMNLPANFEFDSELRFISRLNNTAVLTPAYWELNLRLAWRASKNLTLELDGINLLSPQHLEYPDAASHVAQIERAVYAQATITV